MMMSALAAGMEIPEEQMEALRPQRVRNVKRTHRMVTLLKHFREEVFASGTMLSKTAPRTIRRWLRVLRSSLDSF